MSKFSAKSTPDLFYYIEAFYNRRRLPSSLGYLSPEEYEKRYYEEQLFA
jgi:putative transposase